MARTRARRPDPEVLDLWQGWLRAHQLLTVRLDDELRSSTGMTLEEYDVLVQLAQSDERRLRMSALADALLIARSSCTRLVARLVDEGWVEREADPADGRVVWVALTAAGRAALRRAAIVHLAGIDEHFARHLQRDDATRLGALVDRLLASEQQS
jgi:DNA-binding MarR family transcriptional regulator